MKSMKNKEYLHPATTSTSDNKYPYLCITGSNYEYPKPSLKRSLADCIRSVLLESFRIIERGYKDRGQDAILYRYLDDEDFENNKVR